MRAMEQMPRTCGSALNSAFRSGRSEPPGAGAVRAAGLGHEALDHAVEGDAVIKALAGERLDALHMAGSEIGTQFDDDLALGGFEDECVFGICHGISLHGVYLGMRRKPSSV